MSLEVAKRVLSEVNADDNIWNSEEELDKVTGGNGQLFDRSNCSGDCFVETCTDTVESG